MGRRKYSEYSILDIALASGRGYRTVLRDEKLKAFNYRDFESVLKYCIKHRKEN